MPRQTWIDMLESKLMTIMENKTHTNHLCNRFMQWENMDESIQGLVKTAW